MKISIKSVKIKTIFMKIMTLSMKIRTYHKKISSVSENQNFSRKCELWGFLVIVLDNSVQSLYLLLHC